MIGILEKCVLLDKLILWIVFCCNNKTSTLTKLVKAEVFIDSSKPLKDSCLSLNQKSGDHNETLFG